MREVMPREKPLVQKPEVRSRNFEEVVLGFTAEEAVREASRCILCKTPRCQEKCPLHNQIPQWIQQVQLGHFEEADRIVRETSPMPDICSRLCPQERLCEGACVLGIKHESVAIGLLERFVADHGAKGSEWDHWSEKDIRELAAPPTQRIAAIGSGPASLALAKVLAGVGYEITLFERSSQAGGVLRWLPRFKMPGRLVDEYLVSLRQAGVVIRTRTEVKSAKALLDQGFHAVFIGIGASRPTKASLPGESLDGVVSSTEFLTHLTPLARKRVVVLGGGDTAMDCTRTAIRLGAREVTCLYRRDEANMPGSKKEVAAAKEEGVRFFYLSAPTQFLSRGRGARLACVEYQRMALGEPDASGRRSVTPVEGARFTMNADVAVVAFGYDVENPLEEFSGRLKINPATGATSMEGVFAGGDCAPHLMLVSSAANAGLAAAQGMIRYFAGEPWSSLAPPEGSSI